MPWRVSDRMSTRLEFLCEALRAAEPFATLCARYGIARQTGYELLARFDDDGLAAVTERSHAPRSCPHRTPDAQRAALIALRRQHPTWGAKKLRAVLQDTAPDCTWPAPSTITTVLKQAGLIVPRRRRPRAVPGALAPALTATVPNALWTLDYKGQFTTGDGHYCYPLTLVDSASRFLLACVAHRRISTAGVQRTLEACFRTYGLPAAILSDNGAPFASVAAPRRFSALSTWLIQLGIRPLFTAPRHPEQNGRHERMHRTLKAEATKPPAHSCARQQTRFDAFREEYNRLRPHEALGLTPPVRHYHPSERPYPARVPPLTYPGEALVRRVTPAGVVYWHQRAIYISQSLAGATVRLAPVSATTYELFLAEYWLGTLDVQALRFTSLTKTQLSGITPV